jgi:hypothetical protein
MANILKRTAFQRHSAATAYYQQVIRLSHVKIKMIYYTLPPMPIVFLPLPWFVGGKKSYTVKKIS